MRGVGQKFVFKAFSFFKVFGSSELLLSVIDVVGNVLFLAADPVAKISVDQGFKEFGVEFVVVDQGSEAVSVSIMSSWYPSYAGVGLLVDIINLTWLVMKPTSSTRESTWECLINIFHIKIRFIIVIKIAMLKYLNMLMLDYK